MSILFGILICGLIVIGVVLAIVAGAVVLGKAWDAATRPRDEEEASADAHDVDWEIPLIPRFRLCSWYGRLLLAAYGSDRGWLLALRLVRIGREQRDYYGVGADLEEEALASRTFALARQMALRPPQTEPFVDNGRPISVCPTFWKIIVASYVYVTWSFLRWVARKVLQLLQVAGEHGITRWRVAAVTAVVALAAFAHVAPSYYYAYALPRIEREAADDAWARQQALWSEQSDAAYAAETARVRAEVPAFVDAYVPYVRRLAAEIEAVRADACGANVWEFQERYRSDNVRPAIVCFTRPFDWALDVFLLNQKFGRPMEFLGYTHLRNEWGGYELDAYDDAPVWWFALTGDHHPLANADAAHWRMFRELLPQRFIEERVREDEIVVAYDWLSEIIEEQEEVLARQEREHRQQRHAQRVAERRAAMMLFPEVVAARVHLARLDGDPMVIAYAITERYRCFLQSTGYWYFSGRALNGDYPDDAFCAAIGTGYEDAYLAGTAALGALDDERNNAGKAFAGAIEGATRMRSAAAFIVLCILLVLLNRTYAGAMVRAFASGIAEGFVWLVGIATVPAWGLVASLVWLVVSFAPSVARAVSDWWRKHIAPPVADTWKLAAGFARAKWHDRLCPPIEWQR
ncbi:MAG: hypothetical protein Q7T01_03665 [bacterium]|nr:hypothetical protein [bacterium]